MAKKYQFFDSFSSEKIPISTLNENFSSIKMYIGDRQLPILMEKMEKFA